MRAVGGSLALALGVICLGGCRTLLGPDDARPPPPEVGDTDAGGPDASDDTADATGGFSHLACDLRLQDCPDKRACYPDEAVSGDTVCLPRGAGGPLSPCLSQTDCDARLFCLPSVDPAGRVCVEICRPGADVSGCQPGLTCVALPAYPIGYCRY